MAVLKAQDMLEMGMFHILEPRTLGFCGILTAFHGVKTGGLYLQNAVLWFITFWESSWDVRCIVCTMEMGFVLLIQGYDKHGTR